jgi:hypothetical protein
MAKAQLLRVEFKDFEKKIRSMYSRERQVKNAIYKVVSKTTKFAKSQTSKIIREEVNLKKETVDKSIRAKNPSKGPVPTGTITVSKSSRPNVASIPGATHNKTGVSYRFNKKKGRIKIRGGFFVKNSDLPNNRGGDRSYNLAFKRAGKKRLPIIALKAASPWGVLVAGQKSKTLVEDTKERMRKEMKEQIRVALLRNQGVIKS